MDITPTHLRQQIQQALVSARGLDALPRTSIDQISLECLADIEGSYELLELAHGWLTSSKMPATTGMSDDVKIAWPRIRAWCPHLERMMEAMA